MALSFLPVRDQGLGPRPDAADGFIAPDPAPGLQAAAPSLANPFKPPLLFIENRGQLDPGVRFYLKDGGHTAYFTDTEIVFDARFRVGGAHNRGGPHNGTDTDARENPALERMVVRMSPVGTAGPGMPRAAEPDQARINVFRGGDPTRWLTDIPTYREIFYEDIYPGVDLRFYGQGRELRYDFIVRPGADPAQLAVRLTGAESLAQADGRLIAKGKLGEIVQSGLRAYQTGPAGEEEVEARFRLLDDDVYGFEIGPYDPSLPLVIDPVLVFSTYLGGSGADEAADIEVTSSAVYVCGKTNSDNFPIVSAYDSTRSGTDAFVSKFSLDGSTLLFSTFLGGSGADDATGLYVDASAAWVAGTTESTNFPTVTPRQATNGGDTDLFVAKLSLAGNSLLYSTYHGGADSEYGGGADGGGMFLYISGYTSSLNFPVYGPGGAYQTTRLGSTDAVVVAFRVTDNYAYYSTYLGGSGVEIGTAVAYAAGDYAVITGWTSGSYGGGVSFPTTTGVVQPTFGGGNWDVFVSKLSTSGSNLQFSTFLGGASGDGGEGVATDNSGNVYVVGYTYSSNFPTHNAYQSFLRGPEDGFLAKLNSAGTAMPYGTYFGGDHQDLALAVDVDFYWRAHITGYTWGSPSTFPQRYPVQTGLTSGVHEFAFMAKIKTNETGDASLISSSLIGANDGNDRGRGISLLSDYASSGKTYVCGWTESAGFPTVNAYQGDQGIRDAFVLLINDVEIRVDPESVDFGAVLSGSTSSWQTVTVYSDGQSHLTMGTVSLVGADAAHFGLQNDQVTNQSIAPGATKTIQVRFQPTATGSRSAVLRFPNNDPDENPTDVPLYGVAPLPPTVTTTAVSAITQTTATSGGNVSSDGGAAVTARGVCWSTSPNPTTANSKTTNGTGLGTFTSNLTGLTPGTLYYVRAYATNMAGTAYGNQRSFTTLVTTPTVTTTAVSAITQTTATSGGNVTSDGGAAVTARGVCWSTSPNPTTADSKTTNGTGTGAFTSNLTGLTRATLYYVRAYATNSVGTAYGSQVSFTTLADLPTVITWAITSIAQTTATGGGNVTSDGGAAVTARGVCWSTSPGPTTADFKTTNGTGTGAFSSSLTGLTPGTLYYVRAYATNSVGTAYGGPTSFTTLSIAVPTVATTTVSAITQTTATSGGNISSDGGAAVTARGVCWSTSPSPTTADSKTTDGTGTGTFTSSLTGLTPGTLYYVRAYATNSVGPAYGNQESFTTAAALPYEVILPEVIWASATGGGTWVSEVQIIDQTGGSEVSVYFNSSAGRRGPFPVWTGPAADRSVKFTNFLETVDSLDAGAFDYYSKVGAVEFFTQDASHEIRVSARTVNGNYGKTMQGRTPGDAELADTSRPMMIQNLVSNASYRSSTGFFNPTADPVTADFTLYGPDGPIGTPFTRSFTGYGFQSFSVFNQAGIPYPGSSYDHAWLLVQPTTGTGKLMCFGATANSATNDPSAHTAVQVNTGYWNSPSSSQTLPEVIWSPATGGGTWLSEVQVTDLTGGSQVSVTFSTSTGVRGPFLLWTGPAANRSTRFVNLLETIDGLDPGAFDYYLKVGAVKFETQDAGHLVHVTARTINGNYGKTFQGLNNHAENLVSTGSLMMIPDVISNATYRSSAGFFNTGIDAVTIEYKIYGASGQIGSTFTKDIPAGGFISFRIFEAAGEPYPTTSHDNAWLLIKPTSGTAGIMCFGATANNLTNDPSAHSALRY